MATKAELEQSNIALRDRLHSLTMQRNHANKRAEDFKRFWHNEAAKNRTAQAITDWHLGFE